MSIEIRELVIRANVTSDGSKSGDQPASQKNEEQEWLIEECVREVLKIIDAKNER